MKTEEISIDALLQKLQSAQRELNYWRRVYPRLVANDLMSQMEGEITCMERILDILDQINGRLV